MLEFLGLVSDSHDWIYGLSLGGLELSSCVCFGQFRDELRTVDWPMYAVFGVIAKMSNKLVV